ncbi:MAG TPA: lipoate--protein ligase [Bacteroidales bacterium]|nr:lipoate--protein ligase [Bacteroidales bacterium]HSA42463.1 lipoate--protein ligase [Bacteroidales bacterium]
MLCVYYPSNDAYFNLATEEYLLKEFKEDFFTLWRNEPSIIVGKHQNALAEINLDFVRQNNIKVVRRLSGGGTVFHDLGNLNFTFIVTGESNQLVDFHKYTQPILDVLRKLGVDARFEGRNDLTINGLKFSGNAEHVYHNRILHHGTLLFSSVMTDLSSALNVDPLKFTDKAVKSVRSRVTNISGHLHDPLDIMTFKDLIMSHIMEMYPDARPYALTEADLAGIQKLCDGKYSTWEWNFGYSPKYNLQRFVKTAGGKIEFDLNVVNGIIDGIKIFGDFFNTREPEEIESMLLGCRHEAQAVRDRLRDVDIGLYFTRVNLDEFISGLF